MSLPTLSFNIARQHLCPRRTCTPAHVALSRTPRKSPLRLRDQHGNWMFLNSYTKKPTCCLRVQESILSPDTTALERYIEVTQQPLPTNKQTNNSTQRRVNHTKKIYDAPTNSMDSGGAVEPYCRCAPSMRGLRLQSFLSHQARFFAKTLCCSFPLLLLPLGLTNANTSFTAWLTGAKSSKQVTHSHGSCSSSATSD